MTLVMEMPKKLRGEIENMKLLLAKSLYEKRKITLQEAGEMTNETMGDFMRKMSDL